MQLQGSNSQDFELQSRVLSWMMAMFLAAGEAGAAEGYLLNLLSWRAFGERSKTTLDNMA